MCIRCLATNLSTLYCCYPNFHNNVLFLIRTLGDVFSFNFCCVEGVGLLVKGVWGCTIKEGTLYLIVLFSAASRLVDHFLKGGDSNQPSPQAVSTDDEDVVMESTPGIVRGSSG